MKKILFYSLLTTIIFSQETTSYSWEDGSGTILGSYGNLANPANIGSSAGVTPYDGSRMLTVSESPLDGTPQAFIAWVTDLSAGQEIEACFYGFDNTPSSSPSLRIWGSWSDNDDITAYAGSADGNTDYTDGSGWGQVCWTFSTNQENWDDGEALVIQARLYSSSSGSDPTVYYIDLVEITAPNGATVNYPGGASAGCTDETACNYNPFATQDDGSCVLSQGSISIADIQYTVEQGEYCYESDHNQECWTTSGIVTAKNPIYPNFYIQDGSSEYSGIYVHGYSSTPPSLGDDITITATVNEYYSLTQLIDAGPYSVNSNNNSLDELNISTGDLVGCMESGEEVESMLVRVNNVIVTTPSNEYGEWYVDDGSGAVKIDDKLFDGEWFEPSTSQEFEGIIGIVDYAYSEFSILPRTMSDFILCSTCPVANAGEDQSVSGGVLVTLDGSNSYDPDGTIFAYEWTQLSGASVNLSDEEAAVTTFISPESFETLTFRLTVYDNEFNEAIDEISIINVSPITIQEIQYTTEQGTYCYETPMAGEIVTTTGIVTAIKPGDNPNFYLSQPGANSWGGIYVYDNTISPAIGDELLLSATVNEWYSFTQLIDVTSSSIITNENQVAPISLSTGILGTECSFEGEGYEGMLVKMSNVTIEGIDEFGNWTINDGSGPALVSDYFFDGNFPSVLIGDEYGSITGVVEYSYSEFKILPRNISDIVEENSCPLGDLNGDNGWNVLDIVILANCILENNCEELQFGCAGDLNGDNGWNVLDIVTLANCVLENNCNGRIDDASSAFLIKKNNQLFIDGDGFIGGVQISLSHGNDFSIKMTDNALFADYITNDKETKLLVITPGTEQLFTYNGNFEIVEIIVANSQSEIPVSLPVDFILSAAFPNPFNPTTNFKLTIPVSGDVSVKVFNLFGQSIATLLDGFKSADTYSLVWDAKNMPSGMYFMEAQFGGVSKTQKLMLIK